MSYNINLFRDNDACVWVATSTDVPGLVLESGSVDALIERVKLHPDKAMREMIQKKLRGTT